MCELTSDVQHHLRHSFVHSEGVQWIQFTLCVKQSHLFRERNMVMKNPARTVWISWNRQTKPCASSWLYLAGGSGVFYDGWHFVDVFICGENGHSSRQRWKRGIQRESTRRYIFSSFPLFHPSFSSFEAWILSKQEVHLVLRLDGWKHYLEHSFLIRQLLSKAVSQLKWNFINDWSEICITSIAFHPRGSMQFVIRMLLRKQLKALINTPHAQIE